MACLSLSGACLRHFLLWQSGQVAQEVRVFFAPDTLPPSVSDPAEIPTAILAHNLFGTDIDLRAVQLSALALYLKARSWRPAEGQRNTQHAIRVNLACADVRPLDGARLGTFLREARFTRPIYERLIRAL